jgi:hypothetical protein
MRKTRFLLGLLIVGAWSAEGESLIAQLAPTDVVRLELQRCETLAKGIRGDTVERYQKKLTELRLGFQKAGDLESALILRAEEQRVAAEQSLDTSHLVEEPRSLREAQESFLQKQVELIERVVGDTLPKLGALKKDLTVAGRLDEAVEVRSAISKLQNTTAPAQRLSAGTQASVEDVFQAYQINRERAERMYKGVKLLASGKVLGIRPDSRDPSNAVLVLAGGADGAFVDCAFSPQDYRVREERQGPNLFFVISHSNPNLAGLRLQRGQLVELTGKCEGWDGALRFSGCTIPKR